MYRKQYTTNIVYSIAQGSSTASCIFTTHILGFPHISGPLGMPKDLVEV